VSPGRALRNAGEMAGSPTYLPSGKTPAGDGVGEAQGALSGSSPTEEGSEGESCPLAAIQRLRTTLAIASDNFPLPTSATPGVLSVPVRGGEMPH
jgi:hypothetical protein